MTPADAARILAVAAAFDRRTVGETDAKVWADALGDLDPRDCVEAVRAHYRDSTAWCMPAHVRRLVEQHRRARAESLRQAETMREIEGARHVDKAAADKAFREHVAPVLERLGRRGKHETTARQHDCPFCGAHASDPCVVNGRPRNSAHPSRYEAAGLEPPAPRPVETVTGTGPDH